MGDYTITAIEDGWARSVSALTRSEAERRAHHLWNSGRYDLVSVVSSNIVVYFRHRVLKKVK